jgi:hypothetical protein
VDIRSFAREQVIAYTDALTCIETLRTTYELDIRRVGNGGRFVLEGYWDEDDDYVSHALRRGTRVGVKRT